jgi:opacity protein-like surface antigen
MFSRYSADVSHKRSIMQRTLPAMVGALLAASLLATAQAAAAQQPVNRPPPPMQPRPHPQPPPHAQPQPPPHAQPHPNSLGADWRLQQDEARQGVRNHQLMPLGHVIEQVRARHPGRQLDAGLEYQGDRPIYRVRWMTNDGRRIDYLIDAATGAILSGN